MSVMIVCRDGVGLAPEACSTMSSPQKEIEPIHQWSALASQSSSASDRRLRRYPLGRRLSARNLRCEGLHAMLPLRFVQTRDRGNED